MLYFSKQLESTLSEISSNGKRNYLQAVSTKTQKCLLPILLIFILHHYLIKLMQKKIGFLFGDFNIDLLQFNKNKVGKFVATITSIDFFSTISLPTRITDTTSTLIDNIFVSPHQSFYESCNLLTGISDHLARFIISVSFSMSEPSSTVSTYRDWKVLDPKKLSESLNQINWNETVSLERNDLDYSFRRFFDILTSLIDKHIPLKMMSKKRLNNTANLG